MIRKLKALTLAGLAVAALSVLVAPAAQAEATFTIPGASAQQQTTVVLVKDGSEKTAHWVFDFSNAAGTETMSITCNEVLGNTATTDGLMIGPQAADITIVTPAFSGCKTGTGLPMTAKNLGCAFTFTSGGELDIASFGIHFCQHTKEPIVFTGTLCTVEIGEQTLAGIKYHNVTEGKVESITVEASGIENLSYEARGVGCPFGTTSNGKLTTGNSILTGEFIGAMVNLIWEP